MRDSSIDDALAVGGQALDELAASQGNCRRNPPCPKIETCDTGWREIAGPNKDRVADQHCAQKREGNVAGTEILDLHFFNSNRLSAEAFHPHGSRQEDGRGKDRCRIKSGFQNERSRFDYRSFRLFALLFEEKRETDSLWVAAKKFHWNR